MVVHMAIESRIPSVLEFFKLWESDFDTMCRSYHDFFTADCAWLNQGFPITHGPDEAVEKVVEPCRVGLGMETIRVEILNIAEAGDTVFHERIDHIVSDEGTVVMSIPVTGVMDFSPDGRVHDWREYFDSKPILEFMASRSALAD